MSVQDACIAYPIWSIAMVMENVKIWQDVHVEFQEEDVPPYAMEV